MTRTALPSRTAVMTASRLRTYHKLRSWGQGRASAWDFKWTTVQLLTVCGLFQPHKIKAEHFPHNISIRRTPQLELCSVCPTREFGPAAHLLRHKRYSGAACSAKKATVDRRCAAVAEQSPISARNSRMVTAPEAVTLASASFRMRPPAGCGLYVTTGQRVWSAAHMWVEHAELHLEKLSHCRLLL